MYIGSHDKIHYCCYIKYTYTQHRNSIQTVGKFISINLLLLFISYFGKIDRTHQYYNIYSVYYLRFMFALFEGIITGRRINKIYLTWI